MILYIVQILLFLGLVYEVKPEKYASPPSYGFSIDLIPFILGFSLSIVSCVVVYYSFVKLSTSPRRMVRSVFLKAWSIFLWILFINPGFNMLLAKNFPSILVWLQCSQFVVESPEKIVIDNPLKEYKINFYAKNWLGQKMDLKTVRRNIGKEAWSMFRFSEWSLNPYIISTKYGNNSLIIEPKQNGEATILLKFKGKKYKIPVEVAIKPLRSAVAFKYFDVSQIKDQLVLPVILFGSNQFNFKPDMYIRINQYMLLAIAVKYNHEYLQIGDFDADGYEDIVLLLNYEKLNMFAINTEIIISVTQADRVVSTHLVLDPLRANQFIFFDMDLELAKEKAQQAWPKFLELLAERQYDNNRFIKIAVPGKLSTEYFWAMIHKNSRGQIINNEEIVGKLSFLGKGFGVALPKKVTINDIVDWSIKTPEQGVLEGGYSIDVMYKKCKDYWDQNSDEIGASHLRP